jgi:predicted RNA-binding Zn-ribbon protein involved in translation (DUF1610 family)
MASRRKHRTKVRVVCPSCGVGRLDVWRYNPIVGQSVGGDRGQSMDIDDPGDGRAAWVRYRCPDCSTESTWPTREIARAHYSAVRHGRAEIRWDDLELTFESGEPVPYWAFT